MQLYLYGSPAIQKTEILDYSAVFSLVFDIGLERVLLVESSAAFEFRM